MIGISRATYYFKSVRGENQILNDIDLRDLIEVIHVDFPGYGYRRIRHHLLREGYIVNGKRLRRVMKVFGIICSHRKSNRSRGQAMGKKLTFPNKIRGLKLTGPNQVWATDFTYIRLLREYIYVSAVIDLYTRKIVGWSISRDSSHKFCIDALAVAVKNERPPKGVIHHSDRGVQYCCEAYVSYLEKNKFEISMSQPATPEENAYIESFFKTMKREEVYVKDYKTMEDVINNLPKFIEEIYNEKRLHSSLGYLPPSEFEAEVSLMKPAKRPVQKLYGYAV
jgi:transposase InsO family protein